MGFSSSKTDLRWLGNRQYTATKKKLKKKKSYPLNRIIRKWGVIFMPPTPSQIAPLADSLYPTGQAHRAPQGSSTHTWLQPPLFIEQIRPARVKHTMWSMKQLSMTEICTQEAFYCITFLKIDKHQLQQCQVVYCSIFHHSQTYRRLRARRYHLSSGPDHHTSFQETDMSRQDTVYYPHHTDLYKDRQSAFYL